jgi:hypothetical protein
MGFLYRKHPVYARPVPFLGGLAVGAIGLFFGLNWSWDWSLQTGNVFLLILIPSHILNVSVSQFLWLLVALAGFSTAFGLGTVRSRLVRGQAATGWTGWRRATFRVYPITFLLGVFLLLFGVIFLFDASVYGDEVPGGLAAFVYLDYAGLMDRPIVTAVGVIISSLGLACATFLAYERGLDISSPSKTLVGAAVATRPSPAPVESGFTMDPAGPRVGVTSPARAMAPPAGGVTAPAGVRAQPLRRPEGVSYSLLDEDLQ